MNKIFAIALIIIPLTIACNSNEIEKQLKQNGFKKVENKSNKIILNYSKPYISEADLIAAEKTLKVNPEDQIALLIKGLSLIDTDCEEAKKIVGKIYEKYSNIDDLLWLIYLNGYCYNHKHLDTLSGIAFEKINQEQLTDSEKANLFYRIALYLKNAKEFEMAKRFSDETLRLQKSEYYILSGRRYIIDKERLKSYKLTNDEISKMVLNK